MKRKILIDTTDIFIVTSVIAVSGHPVITHLGPGVIYIGLFLLLFTLAYFRNIAISKEDIACIGFFAVLSGAHLLLFGGEVLNAEIGFILKIIIAILCIRLVRDFISSYIHVMYFLAVLSLVFYVPTQVGIDLAHYLKPLLLPTGNLEVAHIGIHNFHVAGSAYRNSGIFWEPGAFAGYLVLAMLFLLMVEDKVSKTRWIVLSLALLTTFSTTGYLAFFIVLAVYILRNNPITDRNLIIVAIPFLLICTLSFGYYVYQKSPFLKNKIEHQIQTTFDQRHRYQINRIGNFSYDLSFIKERPLVGWSPRLTTRGTEAAGFASGQGNGLSGFAVKFGLLGLFGYLLLVCRGFLRLCQCTTLAAMASVVVCVLLVGEQFLNFPLFLTLMFIGTPTLSAVKKRFAPSIPNHIYSNGPGRELESMR